jgi:hypothetical protein
MLIKMWALHPTRLTPTLRRSLPWPTRAYDVRRAATLPVPLVTSVLACGGQGSNPKARAGRGRPGQSSKHKSRGRLQEHR